MQTVETATGVGKNPLRAVEQKKQKTKLIFSVHFKHQLIIIQ